MLDRPRGGACDWPEGRRTGEGMDIWDRSRITVDAAGPRPPAPPRLCPSALPNRCLGEEHGRNLNSRWRWDTVCRATGGAVARARAGVAGRRWSIGNQQLREGVRWNLRRRVEVRGKEYPKHCHDGIKERRRSCWDRDGDLRKELVSWRRRSCIVQLHASRASRFCRRSWVGQPPAPSPRQPGSRTAPARVHCSWRGVPGSAPRARLTLCSLLCQARGPCPSLPAPRFGFAESTLGLDTLPPPPPRLLSRFTMGTLPGHHTLGTPTAASHGGPKPPPRPC